MYAYCGEVVDADRGGGGQYGAVCECDGCGGCDDVDDEEDTDLVLVCSRSFAKKHGLNFKELPIDLPPVEQYLIWHNSDDNDGSHIWMRELIAEAFREAQIT